MVEIRWHGRGGQGAFTASKILGDAAIKDGKYALSFPSFGPERRGAPIQAYTKIADGKITDRSALEKADYILYLDETLFNEKALEDLKNGGLLFLNSKTPERYKDSTKIVAFDANDLSEKILNRPVSNTVMLALLAVKTNVVKVEAVKNALDDFLPEKTARKNKQLIEEMIKVVQDDD